MIGVRVLYRGREETAHEGPRLIPMMLLAEVRETELRRKRKQGRSEYEKRYYVGFNGSTILFTGNFAVMS